MLTACGKKLDNSDLLANEIKEHGRERLDNIVYGYANKKGLQCRVLDMYAIPSVIDYYAYRVNKKGESNSYIGFAYYNGKLIGIDAYSDIGNSTMNLLGLCLEDIGKKELQELYREYSSNFDKSIKNDEWRIDIRECKTGRKIEINTAHDDRSELRQKFN